MDAIDAKPHLPALRQILAEHWQVVAPPAEAKPGTDDWDILLAALTERIGHMMARRHERLMAALYILDISERRYLIAMDQPTQADRAHSLALAILERETEKIASREKYRRKPPAIDHDA